MSVIVRVVLLAYVFGAFGQAINYALKFVEKDAADKSVYHKYKELINIPVGFGVASVITTFLYFMCGLTINGIFYILLIVALVLTGVYLFFERKDLKNAVVRPVMIWAVTIILMLAFAVPGFVYGDAEYVWRGNRWDKNIYATEAIAAWTHPIKYYDSMETEQILKESEVLSYGYNLLVTDRPTAPIMCALSFVSGSSFLFSMYLMYLLYMAMVPGAVLFFVLGITNSLENLDNKKVKIPAILISLLYPISFWGQYIYDIDALSEMSSIALFVVATLSAIRLLSEPRNSVTVYTYLMITMTSGWILYFEDAVVHCVLFGFLAMLLLIVFKSRTYFIKLLKICAVPLAGVVAILITNPRLFVFLKSNGGSAFDASRQNWSYFIQYWNGKNGISDSGSYFTALSKIENTFLAWNGLWFITPDYQVETTLLFKMLWFGIDAIVCVMILSAFIGALVKATKGISNSRSLFAFMVITGLIMFVVMILFGKTWTANKMLLYISAYIFILVLFPILDGKNGPEKSILSLVLALIMICLQMCLGGIRIFNEFTNDDHNGIDWNYPSDQEREVKEEYVFNYQELIIDKNATYILDINDRLYQLYVKMNLAFDGIQPYNYQNYDFNGLENDNYYPDDNVVQGDNVYIIGTQKNTDGKEYLVINALE